MPSSIHHRWLAVEVAGAPVSPDLGRRLAATVVRQCMSAPTLAELTFADPPGESLRPLCIGARLGLSVNARTRLFEGEVTSVEDDYDGANGHVVRVRAYDRLHRLRKRQRLRAMNDVSVATLAAELAAELGLTAAGGSEAGSHELVVQHDQSDFELLVGLAASSGLYPFLDDEVLRLQSLQGEGTALDLRLGRGLHSLRIVRSVESLRRQSQALAWDVRNMRVVSAQVAGPGAMEGDDAFPGLGERTLVNRFAASADEACALANTDLERANGRDTVLEAVAEGDTALHPGCIVRVRAHPQDASETFVITEAEHRFSGAGGYVVTLGSRPPRTPTTSRTPIFTWGKIDQVDDPEARGRVRASLPTYGAVLTGWMPVLALGAGDGKGAVMLPESGDDVLVLFPDGDPARGIVMGGLFGERDLPGPGAPERRGFTLRSPGGQELLLGGSQPLARLATAAGDVFELGPGGSRLSACQDLLIAAPGRKITILADAIEFERG